MVARIDMPDWLTFQMPNRIGKNWHASRAMRDIKTVERWSAGFKPFAKMLQIVHLRLAHDVENEWLPGRQPVANVALLFHGDTNRRRRKSRLHDPTSEHTSGTLVRADGENIKAARDTSQDGIKRTFRRHNAVVAP